MATVLNNHDNGEAMLQALTATKSPADRTLRASRMFTSARNMLSGYLRELHPDWTPEEIHAELLRRIHGAT